MYATYNAETREVTLRFTLDAESHKSSTGKTDVWGSVSGKTGIVLAGGGELRLSASAYVKQPKQPSGQGSNPLPTPAYEHAVRQRGHNARRCSMTSRPWQALPADNALTAYAAAMNSWRVAKAYRDEGHTDACAERMAIMAGAGDDSPDCLPACLDA